MPLDEIERRTLWISVWHSDMFGRNDFLGEVMLPMAGQIANEDSSPKWYSLQERVSIFYAWNVLSSSSIGIVIQNNTIGVLVLYECMMFDHPNITNFGLSQNPVQLTVQDKTKKLWLKPTLSFKRPSNKISSVITFLAASNHDVQ